jgi:DNA-binding transcriptional MocR family regulator
LAEVSFICPVPGYDRHFSICEHFGIRMIPVALRADGPDMDAVEGLVATDASVKGIWCVPRHSNPSGAIYSDEVVGRLARLECAASDFRIFWDDAYAIHDLFWEDDATSPSRDIDAAGSPTRGLAAFARQAGNEDIYYHFASTSKVTFAGAGIAALSASAQNLSDIRSQLVNRTIGPDKLNQLRHALFFSDAAGAASGGRGGAEAGARGGAGAGRAPGICPDLLAAHMERHAAILRPKFRCVIDAIAGELEPLGLGACTRPKGGYFVSFESSLGCAREIVDLARSAGVTLTPAGAAYPHGHDPGNSNIRIAPSYPSLDDLRQAMEVFVLSVKLASTNHLLR